LKQVLRLLAKSFVVYRNDKVAVLLTFIVPLILMTIFGSIFGRPNAGPQGMRLALLNESGSPLAAAIERTLDTTKAFRVLKTWSDESGKEVRFDTATIQDYVRHGQAVAALVLPSDLFTDTSIGMRVKLYYDPKNEMEIQTSQGLLRQIIYRQLPNIVIQSGQRMAVRSLGKALGDGFTGSVASLVTKYFKVDSAEAFTPPLLDAGPGSDSTGPARVFNNLVNIDSRQLVGAELKNPGATRSVGGWAMTFLLFTLTAAAGSLFDEKQSGVLLRLLTSPVSRLHILWSKYLFNLLLGIAQLLFLFFAGWILFDIDIFSNFLNLLIIVVAAAAAATAFGMLLAAFSRTRQQAQGLGTLFILTMSSIGGAWFPTSFMPEAIQFMSKLTIVYWSMDGIMEVLWRNSGFTSLLPHLGVLLGISALVSAVSIVRFKKGDLF
jgi:ABC-2 type transport system permease protein